MMITEKGEIIFNDENENTQYVTKQELKKAWKYYKDNLHPKHSSDNNQGIVLDPIIEAVRTKLLDRSTVGIKKYGTTLKDNTTDNYLNHLQMELMDACNYIQVLLQQDKDITDIIKNEPNDWELGKQIRKIYGSKN